jgi:galactose mutarotase-like enzyme
MHEIKSDALKAAVNPVGAELFSLVSRQSGREYIWQGDPTWWAGRAPVLFPVVCSLKGNSYVYKGKTYHMPKHGFVRKAVFTLVEIGLSQVICEYTDNDETREAYPFAFSFRVICKLEGNTLYVTYRTENRGGDVMYFSVGAHEAYQCPFMEGEAFEDYYLEFDCDGTYMSDRVDEAGLLKGDLFPVIENGRVLPLRHELFIHDALIFKDIPSSHVCLKSRKSASYIEVDCRDAPHLGIWQKPGAPYICIEPWYGLPDGAAHSGAIEEKCGILSLAPGAAHSWTHTITIHE